MPDRFFSHATSTIVQWIRASSGSDSDISGATASTYTLIDDDEGKTIKVKVSFTDRDGNGEGPLTSVAYPPGGTVLAAINDNTAPTSANRTVTATEDTNYTFSVTDFPIMDTDTSDGLASVKIVTLPASGTLKLSGTAIPSVELPKTVTSADIADNRLKYTPPEDAHGTGIASFTFKVNDGTDDSVAVNTLTVDVTAVNDPATGKPGIAGTARVGQTLTATTGTIADVEGLPEPFLTDTDTSFQWIRVSSGIDNDHFGRDGQHLHAAPRRRGQDDQGEGSRSGTDA